jgi:lysine 6-dehydrogenase
MYPISFFPIMSYLVLGAGLMGRALVHDLLVNSGVDDVTVADMDKAKLDAVKKKYGKHGLRTVTLNAKDKAETSKLIKGHSALINATSYTLNIGLTDLAIKNGCHMCDLGGNMDVVESQMKRSKDAKKAGVTILPNCGLAPGLANVLATWLMKHLDTPKAVKIFVGGLPQQPKPPLNYMQLFSMQGLINEYVEPCDAIIKKKKVKLQPMQDIEEVDFPAPWGKLEAFNTSGGISMMVKTYAGKVETMYYKTLRFPGHCAIFRTFLDLGFMDNKPVALGDQKVSPRALLEKSLAKYLPKDGPDATLMRIEAFGQKEGKDTKLVMQMIDRADPANGMSSMMRTTAFPTSIIAQMIVNGRIKERGVFTPEMVVDGADVIKEMKKRRTEL